MKKIVITGSTRGIGLGMAKEFLNRGHAVVISSRSKKTVNEAQKTLQDQFAADRVHGIVCDVADSAQVQALWDGSMERFGAVDIWINNAGITNSMKSLFALDLSEISPVVNTNITGLIYGAIIALRGMDRQGFGYIYNMYGHGSNDNKVSGLHVYGTTKRGVKYFTEALIQDVDDTPVMAGSISPGIVVTDFLINDMRKMEPDQLETVKAIYNCLADTVETVTPFLVEEVLKSDKNGAEISWLTEQKAQERMSSDEYCSRDLFSQYGL